MAIEQILPEDFDEIKSVQPPDWPDIIPVIDFYIKSPFCHPIKVKVNERIVGIGSAIFHKNVAWLAHIIVHQDYRNRGIGSRIVDELIFNVRAKNYTSILLIATELGEPIYRKAGFKKVTDYIFFKREKPISGFTISERIVPYNEDFKLKVLNLDEKVTGEKRPQLLENSLPTSRIFLENDNLLGYYMPALGEGLIIAENDDAGLELMKLKYSGVNKAVIPADNISGINFLKSNGFIEVKKGTRMILGKEIQWHPEKIYSRIGGNLG